MSLQSLSAHIRDDNTANVGAKRTSYNNLTNCNGLSNSMHKKPSQLKTTSNNSNYILYNEKNKRSVHSLNNDVVYENVKDDRSTSNNYTSFATCDMPNASQKTDQQSTLLTYDHHLKIDPNRIDNAELYRLLQTEKDHEEPNNNSAKNSSFNLFPSCGVINFTKTSDLESAMKSIEGIFFNDSKCYGYQSPKENVCKEINNNGAKTKRSSVLLSRDIPSTEKTTDQQSKLLTYDHHLKLDSNCKDNAELYQSLDTKNVYEELNNNIAKHSSFSLFPSCGVINFTKPDLESTINPVEDNFINVSNCDGYQSPKEDVCKEINNNGAKTKHA